MRLRTIGGRFEKEGKLILIQCKNCKIDFRDFTSVKRRFCSRKCYELSKRVPSDTSICHYCKAAFNRRKPNGRLLTRIGCSASCSAKHAKLANPVRYWLGRPKPTFYKGERHHMWKGGITPVDKKIRQSEVYRVWRKHVFTRDDYTCQGCGVRGGYIEADHELPYSLYPELRFEILNGRTLCRPCHKASHKDGFMKSPFDLDSSYKTGAYKKWLHKV